MFNQSKAFAIGLLVAVFLAGIAAGVTGGRWLAERRGPPARPNRNYADRLAQQLQLSDAQRDSVVVVLRRYDPQMRAIFDSVQPQLDSLRERLRVEIRAQLTPEQQITYQQLIERGRARFARRDSASQRGDRHNDD
jgi:Spy/CpxP family protein refolding chaperone